MKPPSYEFLMKRRGVQVLSHAQEHLRLQGETGITEMWLARMYARDILRALQELCDRTSTLEHQPQFTKKSHQTKLKEK